MTYFKKEKNISWARMCDKTGWILFLAFHIFDQLLNNYWGGGGESVNLPSPPMEATLGMILSSALQFNKSLNLAYCCIENAQLKSGTFDLGKFSHATHGHDATRLKCITEKKQFWVRHSFGWKTSQMEQIFYDQTPPRQLEIPNSNQQSTRHLKNTYAKVDSYANGYLQLF